MSLSLCLPIYIYIHIHIYIYIYIDVRSTAADPLPHPHPLFMGFSQTRETQPFNPARARARPRNTIWAPPINRAPPLYSFLTPTRSIARRIGGYIYIYIFVISMLEVSGCASCGLSSNNIGFYICYAFDIM